MAGGGFPPNISCGTLHEWFTNAAIYQKTPIFVKNYFF
jgi:hypothetical protein